MRSHYRVKKRTINYEDGSSQTVFVPQSRPFIKILGREIIFTKWFDFITTYWDGETRSTEKYSSKSAWDVINKHKSEKRI